MILPGGVAIFAPITIGLLIGAKCLGGMLVGAIASGFVLAVMMSNAGGAWDNSKKYIENENTYGGQKRWIPATITATDARGAIQVDVKPNWWIEVEQQADRVRRRRTTEVATPEGFERFEKNERVEYKSDTHKSWVPAIVQAVDPKTGAIQLDVKPGFWLEPQVIAEKVRRCKPGTPRGSVRTPSPARNRDSSPSRAPSVGRLPGGERQGTPSKRSSTPSARRLWPDAVPSRCYTPLRGRQA